VLPGAFVALAQRWLGAHFALVFLAAATAFGVTAVAGFLLAQQVAFNPLELLWDPAQPLRLLAVYALLFVPFFFSATCTCLTFARFGMQAHRVYAYDLAGAGLGCLAILAALFVVTPMQALIAVGVTGCVAAAAAAKPCGASPRVLPAILVTVALALALALPRDGRRSVHLHTRSFRKRSPSAARGSLPSARARSARSPWSRARASRFVTRPA
jgi:hypothetical protein